MKLEDIKIKGVEILSFSSKDYQPRDGKTNVSLDARVGFDFHPSEKLLNVVMELKVQGIAGRKEHTEEIGSIQTAFTFFIEAWDEVITKKGEELVINADIERALIENVYAGARGMLVAQAGDTVLGKLYLPFIDPDMMKPVKKEKSKK